MTFKSININLTNTTGNKLEELTFMVQVSFLYLNIMHIYLSYDILFGVFSKL